MITPQLVMIPPVLTTARRSPSINPQRLLFFEHAGHQEDVVIFAYGDQDHEQKDRHFPVEPLVARVEAASNTSCVAPIVT